jgi:hypothetical protein
MYHSDTSVVDALINSVTSVSHQCHISVTSVSHQCHISVIFVVDALINSWRRMTVINELGRRGQQSGTPMRVVHQAQS